MREAGLGIDIGNGSISIVVVEGENIIYKDYRLHRGELYQNLVDMLGQVETSCGDRILYAAVNPGAVCLYPGIQKKVQINRISSLLEGQRMLYPDAGSIVEMGAQNSCFLTGIRERETLSYAMNGECAAGTGAFFEDQMYRLGLPLSAYSEYVRRAKSVPRLAGRCSVFAKTDLIHRQQEGVPVEDILLGLSYAVIRNFKSAVVRKLPVQPPVLVTGGVVYNEGVRLAICDIFGLNEEELLCGEEGAVVSAAGIAACACHGKLAFDWKHPVRREVADEEQKRKALPRYDYEKEALHRTRPLHGGEKLWLGIDVGSTSTNLVLTGEDGAVIDDLYLRTRGNPLGAVQQGMAQLKQKYGEALTWEGIGVTGSGRYYIAEKTGAGTVLDEITAQARAAAHLCPEVDTVFEIGGQDSKYISIRDGQVVDFEMNKVCAAGTGSFVEEQANRMEVSLEEIGNSALKANVPIDLGERCTVLMESKIAAELAAGTDKEDICAGLCRSIVRNYLNRVVGNKRKGEHICLQGGVVHNEGIVAAFYEVFGERLHITPFYDVTGAYGAALAAKEQGGTSQKESIRNEENYRKSQKWFLAGYDGTLLPGKKTVGIPRALMIYKFFPMAYQYFKTLGFNVLLSPETDDKIIALGQEMAAEETCYPVKLLHGHMEWLARKKVDYIFIPCIHTIRHETSGVAHNYGCVYMQTAPRIVASVLGLSERGVELICPVLDLDMGKPQLAGAMIKAGQELGCDKARCAAALAKGAAAMVRCEKNSEKLGAQILDELKPEDKVLVLITRNYGVSDPVLNMGIPGELLKRGCRVLTLSHLKGHDVDLSGHYPNLYWPFAQHILSGAKIIKEHPNLYAVYLTNHGCGPDGMISHLFAEIMGDKPYLKIEVDEHQSKVGVITRIEAFLNSLSHVENCTERAILPEAAVLSGRLRDGKKDTKDTKDTKDMKEPQQETVYLPPLSVYTEWMALYLNQKGKRTAVLPDYTAQDLHAGKAYSTAKEYCTFSAAAGQIANRLQETDGEEKQFLVFQTEGAEADGMVPEILRAVLDADGKRAHLVTPFLEQLLFAEEADILWQVLLLGDAWHCLDEEWREKVRASFREKTAAPDAWSREWTKSLLQEWAVYVTEDRQLLLAGDPIVLHSAYLNQNMEEAVRKHAFVPVYMPLSEYLWFLAAESGRKIPEHFTEQLHEFMQIYRGVYGSWKQPDERLQEIREKFPLVHGANLRYLCSLMEQELSHGKGMILVSPEYANYASVMEMLRTGSKYPLLHARADGNEEAEEVERREIFLGLLE